MAVNENRNVWEIVIVVQDKRQVSVRLSSKLMLCVSYIIFEPLLAETGYLVFNMVLSILNTLPIQDLLCCY